MLLLTVVQKYFNARKFFPKLQGSRAKIARAVVACVFELSRAQIELFKIFHNKIKITHQFL